MEETAVASPSSAVLGALGDPAEPAAVTVEAPVEPTYTGSLSPSRAGDFMTCPLLFRFRTIDKLTEPPSPDGARGTVVHRALESLFELPPVDRTLDTALALVDPAWREVLEANPELAALFDAPETEAAPAAGAGPSEDTGPAEALERWLESARALVRTYFTLEDPSRLGPAELECHVEVVLDDGLRLHGYLDRLDRSPAGDLRVVDYKTGRAPREAYEAKALFQLRFYAYVLWRSEGVVPRELRLYYLSSGETLVHHPDEADLLAVERKLRALWAAVDRARQTGHYPPNRSALCGWCAHQALCPEFGGTPPPLPSPDAAAEPADSMAHAAVTVPAQSPARDGAPADPA